MTSIVVQNAAVIGGRGNVTPFRTATGFDWNFQCLRVERDRCFRLVAGIAVPEM